MTEPDSASPTADRTAAEQFLRAFRRQGVTRVFANLGTDHTPLLEAAASVRAAGEADAIPEILSCPHEFAAMSAAHGYAALTGDPQVVLVHVDVGTQNLGAAMHNAHRADAPVFVLAGLAPVTDSGHSGSRDHPVHYFQDTFDQPGIVREYCRWTDQYRPPADPAETVRRGLERAGSEPAGPVYVTATREALSRPVETLATAGDPTRSIDWQPSSLTPTDRRSSPATWGVIRPPNGSRPSSSSPRPSAPAWSNRVRPRCVSRATTGSTSDTIQAWCWTVPTS